MIIIDALVQEAQTAFELNISVFAAHERQLVAKNKQGKYLLIIIVSLLTYLLSNKSSGWPISRYIAVGTWFAIAIAFLHHRGAFNGFLRR
jgi:hypothetical protein